MRRKISGTATDVIVRVKLPLRALSFMGRPCGPTDLMTCSTHYEPCEHLPFIAEPGARWRRALDVALVRPHPILVIHTAQIAHPDIERAAPSWIPAARFIISRAVRRADQVAVLIVIEKIEIGVSVAANCE